MARSLHIAPVAALLALALAPSLPSPKAQEPRVVEITARRFAFTPAEITLRRDEAVVLRLHSEDVTHGFFMKPLGIDATIVPGKVLEIPLRPATPGRYTVICDHFCGAGHGNMKMTIVVE
jgi:cytochrome c oxidase subunit II